MKEAKAKIRTLRNELESCLSRTVLENHAGVACSGRGSNNQNQLAPLWLWLDEHRSKGLAVAFDKWLHHSGRKFCGWRRVVGMKDMFLGLFGAGQGAIDHSFGAPGGVDAARAIKLEPDASAWEVLLECAGAAMGPQATRPIDQGRRAENTVACRSFVAEKASGRTTGVHQKERWVKLGDAKVGLQSPQKTLDQSFTTTNAGSEWKVQSVTT